MTMFWISKCICIVHVLFEASWSRSGLSPSDQWSSVQCCRCGFDPGGSGWSAGWRLHHHDTAPEPAETGAGFGEVTQIQSMTQ